MAEALKALNRKRGGIKHKMTTFKTFLNGIEKEGNVEAENLTELRLRYERFLVIQTEFEEVQSEIEKLLEDDNLNDHYKQSVEFEDNYYPIVASVTKLLANLDPISESPNASQSNVSIQNNAVKLPMIQLPHFNGSHDTWIEFRDTFVSLIHKNTEISSIHKFHYLRSTLSGSALDTIRGTEFSANGYDSAWQVLCKRFDNNRSLIRIHIKSILNLPTINKESSKEIRTFVDLLSNHIAALRGLKQEVDKWDTILLVSVTDKLDKVTVKEWEAKIIAEFGESFVVGPKVQDLIKFLQEKAAMLEQLEGRKDSQINKESKLSGINAKVKGSFVAVTYSCYHCKGDHALWTCQPFLKFNINQRMQRVRELGLCTNCLRTNHSSQRCYCAGCKICHKKLNSLLHTHESKNNNNNESEPETVKKSSVTNLSSCHSSINEEVILSTAVVKIYDSEGKAHSCRALLDSGSQSNFITQSFVQRLNLKTTRANITLIGINSQITNITTRCSITLTSHTTQFQKQIECYVLQKITERLPVISFDSSLFNIPNECQLADPTFDKSQEIDLLIGSTLFWKLIVAGNIQLPKGPVLQNTVLGWIISGAIPTSENVTVHCNFAQIGDLNEQLKSFWEIEENSYLPKLHEATANVDEFFQNTVERDYTGRYVVQIPFNDKINELGDSRFAAEQRLISVERRFIKDSNFETLYKNFMNEYQQLGHMNVVTDEGTGRYFLPHHGVIKKDSTTTQLRVVFDGSNKSSSGVSINEAQNIGPTIQRDLFSIILQFRMYQYAITADIKQMYRQVLVHPNCRKFQSILWRESNTADIKTYELNTVTYGTASAPYLAVRCLFHLANQFEEKYPKACEIIRSSFYVDDLLTGDNDPNKLLENIKTINKILESAGFQLRKFISNDSTIMSNISDAANPVDTLLLGQEDTKTLGICWATRKDNLFYKTSEISTDGAITKRNILSVASKLFDPLGLLSPIVIKFKLMIQQLWTIGVDWDEQLPADIINQWKKITSEFHFITSLIFPRHCIIQEAVKIELHSFADASKRAYGACIFVRSFNIHKEILVRILCAKSRVAPIKAVTIPRLELCAALLSAQLTHKVIESLNLNIDMDIFYWSDSQVVLQWIKTDHNKLNPFVGNRVQKIKGLSGKGIWSYVNTRENPADIISRGVTPSQLRNYKSWWDGPEFLKNIEIETSDKLKIAETDSALIPELRKSVAVVATNFESFSKLFDKYSCLSKLIRVMSYVIRFINNCKPNCSKVYGPLNTRELNNATKCITKIVQSEFFHDEISQLRSSKTLSKTSKLLSLAPFVDEDGILRVGGRLKLSNYDFDKKHPMLLPKNNTFSKLILKYEHIRLLHAGTQQVLASSRDRFWILSAKSLIKAIISKCLQCFKFKRTRVEIQMGNLPRSRITNSYVFEVTGIDYCGPFMINDKRGRGAKLIKSYICLFICFSTKCCHLELVTDLTTENFIASLRRFASRRGVPAHIHSDNGKNFVGANKQLRALTNFIRSNSNEISEMCSQLGTQWHFIPPYSPHFGGLWESNIKSTKSHLYKILTNTSLTYEEFQTVIIQIEAILNSRPLCTLSSDPNDPKVLTPSHLLIGHSLSTIPDPNVTEVPVSKLSRFQYMQSLVQNYWKRWAQDYLTSLQMRTKWKTSTVSYKRGSLVILRDRSTAPCQWKMGIIEEVHYGADGIVRVVDIRTTAGTIIKRAATLVSPLPNEDSE